MKDHHLKGGNGIKRAVRSAPADNGRIPHHIYNNDIKRFQARKYSNEIKKKELEKKVHEKSSMLRKYAKLCAREGIISDRVHIGTRSDDNTTASNDRGNSSNFTDGLGSSNSSSANKKNQHQLPKPNHFAKKILKQAQQLLKEKEEKEQQFQEKLHHKEEAMKLRLKKHKAITQKTTKGQPVLNNQIKLLLEKLQK
jgi:hypothetical protein